MFERGEFECLKLYFLKETQTFCFVKSHKSLWNWTGSRIFLTWTKTVVLMWRVSIRSDKWFNHSRCSAIDWLRSPLTCWRTQHFTYSRAQWQWTSHHWYHVWPTWDKLSFSSAAPRRTCSSLSICSFSRSSSSCIIIRLSSDFTVVAILAQRNLVFYKTRTEAYHCALYRPTGMWSLTTEKNILHFILQNI